MLDSTSVDQTSVYNTSVDASGERAVEDDVELVERREDVDEVEDVSRVSQEGVLVVHVRRHGAPLQRQQQPRQQTLPAWVGGGGGSPRGIQIIQ